MTYLADVRKWEDGTTITRADAEAEGWQWSVVCLYTEPVEATEVPVEVPSSEGALRPDGVLFSPAVLLKAEGIVATEGAVCQDPEHPEVWRVTSHESQVRPYRIQIGYDRTWATCTCAHGVNNGGVPRCSHLAAVLMVIEEREQTK